MRLNSLFPDHTCPSVGQHFLLAVLLWLSVPLDAAEPPLYQLFAEKTQAVSLARQGMQEILAFVHARPDLFPARKLQQKRFTSRKQRIQIWQTWHAFLDQLMLLDKVGRQLEAVSSYPGQKAKETSFRIRYAAFLAQYRLSMDFISLMENDPAMHVTLNEAVAEMGIPADSYSRLKYRFLNAGKGIRFVRLNGLYHIYGKDPQLALTAGMEADIKAIWNAGKGRGPRQTAKNAWRIGKDAGLSAWFPIQKNVSEWMGDVKVKRLDHSLISAGQIQHLQTLLQPGDILLERREWYLSNVGLPGYWSHTALYVGTSEERQHYFKDAALGSIDLQDGDFEAYLRQQFPQDYAASLKRHADGHYPRVIEAISEGVSFTTLEHSADADSIAILRPRLSKAEKARAIAQAFFYHGRPYDFNFDFLTDAALVCTELIYKAYEPGSEYQGLRLPLVEILGRKATPANEFARLYDSEQNLPAQQFDLIAFLDGHERQGRAVVSDETEFRQSWKRPKWYMVVQDTPLQLLKP